MFVATGPGYWTSTHILVAVNIVLAVAALATVIVELATIRSSIALPLPLRVKARQWRMNSDSQMNSWSLIGVPLRLRFNHC